MNRIHEIPYEWSADYINQSLDIIDVFLQEGHDYTEYGVLDDGNIRVHYVKYSQNELWDYFFQPFRDDPIMGQFIYYVFDPAKNKIVLQIKDKDIEFVDVSEDEIESEWEAQMDERDIEIAKQYIDKAIASFPSADMYMIKE